MTKQEIVAAAKKLADDKGELTMYKLASLWSQVRGERVREQQCYNYKAKGLIKVGANGRIGFEAAAAFVEAKETKRAEREAEKLAEVVE